MSATSRLPSAATAMSYGCRKRSPRAPFREISVSAPVTGFARRTTGEAADCFVTTEFATYATQGSPGAARADPGRSSRPSAASRTASFCISPNIGRIAPLDEGGTAAHEVHVQRLLDLAAYALRQLEDERTVLGGLWSVGHGLDRLQKLDAPLGRQRHDSER